MKIVSHLKKERRKSYPAETIIDADYTDEPELLANVSYQAESLLHSVEKAARIMTSTSMQINLSTCILNKKEQSAVLKIKVTKFGDSSREWPKRLPFQ